MASVNPLLFLILLAAVSVSVSGESQSCGGRRIHIRDLPARFNTALLSNCSTYHPLLVPSLCPFLPNSALGPKTHNLSRSWYRSHSLLLEPFFHRRLLEYPCLVPDPSLADAVFLPYYSALDSHRFLFGPDQNSSADHGLDLFDYISQNDPQIWRRSNGHDHFLVMARPAWDFSQSPDADPSIWGTSFLQLPEFFNLTALVVESRPYPWQEQAIPYLTSFHPSNLARFEQWISRARKSYRNMLMVFAGSGGSPSSAPNVRRSIREECENHTDVCEFVDCSNGKCDTDPLKVMRPMLHSKFCLQPPGDTPTRRGTFDAIISGCIPVFFEEGSARRQYGWHMKEEYGEFSVSIAKEDVVFGGVSVVDVLSRIPEVEVARMREKVLELMPRVIYRRHGASAGLRELKDAFDLAIDGVLRRIKDRAGGPSLAVE